MYGGILAILLPFGLLFAALAYAYVLSASKALDPKFQLLHSLLRVIGEVRADSQHRHAA